MATKTTMAQGDLGELISFGWQLRSFGKKGDELVAVMWDIDGEEQEIAVDDPVRPEPPTSEDTPEATTEKQKAAAAQAKEANASVEDTSEGEHEDES